MTDEVIDYRFRLRRGNAATWATVNDVLLVGEIGLEKDTGLFKIGDGVKAWNALKYHVSGVVDGMDAIEDGQTIVWNDTQKRWEAGAAGVDLVAGSGIDIDMSNPKQPIISSTLGAISLSGRVADYASLPVSASNGDAYYNEDDGLIYIYDSGWPADGDGVSVSSSVQPEDDFVSCELTKKDITMLRFGSLSTGLFPATGTFPAAQSGISRVFDAQHATFMLNMPGAAGDYSNIILRPRIQSLIDAGIRYELTLRFALRIIDNQISTGQRCRFWFGYRDAASGTINDELCVLADTDTDKYQLVKNNANVGAATGVFSSIIDEAEHEVKFVYSDSTVSFYVDGSIVLTRSTSAPLGAVCPFIRWQVITKGDIRMRVYEFAEKITAS